MLKQAIMSSLFQGSYSHFELSPELSLGLSDLGYLNPTKVQKEVFAPISAHQDLVVQSHTGSGKTTAFCLPILSQIQKDLKSRPQVLMLAPTRELAKQVAIECGRLGHHAGVKVAVIYGGASFEAQIAALKAGAQVIVGTPGRLKDLISRQLLNLSQIETVVLDEADEMLSMGFWDDVTHILSKTPKERQTLLFSATLPWVIEQSLGQIANNPTMLNFSSDQVSVQSVRHVLHLEEESQLKSRSLLYALELHRAKRAIVFCNTKDETETLENYLQRFSYRAKALNGDMSQSAREKVLHDIKNGELDVVIATDVAARGIDIPGLSHVFNYELPDNPESYVHRTGRTGRIGNLGVAVSLIRGKDIMLTEDLKKSFGVTFDEVQFPPESEILWMQGERLSLLLTEQADGVEISQYRPIAKSMLQRGDLAEILAFLMRSHFSKRPSQPQQAHEPRSQRPQQRPERSERPARPPRAEPRAPSEPSVPATLPHRQIYITLGKLDGFEDLTQLANHMSELSKIDLGHFTGAGNLRDTSSHLEVDTEVAEQIKTAVHGLPRASGVTETLTCDFGTGSSQKKPPHRNHRPRRPQA
ncbi:MAG: DEAD/DEAH box helicase [Myxococcota bacterium]